jgi:hypothetical protein
MRTIILFIFGSMLCAGQSFGGDSSFTWDSSKRLLISQSFLASSQVADAISSRGLEELNPVLGRGPFGTRQETIKGVAVAAVLLTEWSLRKHPQLIRGFTWMNYAVGGMTWGVAAHNWSLK